MKKQLINVAFMKQISKRGLEVLILLSALMLSNLALAGGGLQEGTDQANTIKTWAYGFLGVVAFLYMIWHVIMAMLDKKPWSDVLMALVHVTIAGAVIVATQWAWSVWGS